MSKVVILYYVSLCSVYLCRNICAAGLLGTVGRRSAVPDFADDDQLEFDGDLSMLGMELRLARCRVVNDGDGAEIGKVGGHISVLGSGLGLAFSGVLPSNP